MSNNNHHSRRGNIPFRQISSRRGLLPNRGNDDQRQEMLLHDRENLPRQVQSRRGKSIFSMASPPKNVEEKNKVPKKGGNPKGNPNMHINVGNIGYSKVRDKEGLVPKQRLFVEEYMKDFNGTQSAIRAGYSARTASSVASQHLNKVSIKTAIEKRQREMAVKLELDRESILDRYKCLMDYRITDFFNDDGSLKPLSEIPVRSLYAIQGFKHNTRMTVNQDDHRQQIQDLIKEFNLPVKQNVLDSVVKMLGFNKEEKHEYGGKLELELVLPESVDRVAEVLGILLGSGLVQRRLAEYSQGELSGDQQAIDAEAE